jgi:hypothetical protein
LAGATMLKAPASMIRVLVCLFDPIALIVFGR